MENFELRDYQTRLVSKTINLYKEKCPSVCITSPTGSGKTCVALSIVKKLADEFDITISWVAMRRVLLRQAAEMNNKWFGIKNINFVSMFDKNPPIADMITLDECQHAPTTSFASMDSKNPNAFLLGLSATPMRGDKLKLPFQRTLQDSGIHRLIQEGWLAPFHHYAMEEYSPKHVADTYLTDPKKWGKSVIFFHTIEQCYECANFLAAGGIKNTVITGAQSEAYREEQLDAFDAGEFPVVLNVMVLAEGFDCPDMQSVFVRDSARLPTIQQAGRAFRLCEGKTHCNVVQSKNSPWQFTRTATPQESYVQRGNNWYSLGNNDIVNTLVKVNYNKIAGMEIEIPGWLLARAKKKKKVDYSLI